MALVYGKIELKQNKRINYKLKGWFLRAMVENNYKKLKDWQFEEIQEFEKTIEELHGNGIWDHPEEYKYNDVVEVDYIKGNFGFIR